MCAIDAHALRIICEKHGHNDASNQHDMLETGFSSCPQAW